MHCLNALWLFALQIFGEIDILFLLPQNINFITLRDRLQNSECTISIQV